MRETTSVDKVEATMTTARTLRQETSERIDTSGDTWSYHAHKD